MSNPFTDPAAKQKDTEGAYTEFERALANRNHGGLLEMLAQDVTPTGAHYLLTHFDVPMLDPAAHVLRLHDGFDRPVSLTMADIRAMPQVSMPVTLECGGNGRAKMRDRNRSMPWLHEAFGTSVWTGTPLADVIARARPRAGVEDLVFTGADFGFDDGHPHYFARSLTPDQLAGLDALLVHEMNGQPLLPQHGAPLRIVVPGWFGMASVKWLTDVRAIPHRFGGHQQVQSYMLRQHADDPGVPLTELAVKSLMVPPGVPDWLSRARLVRPGRVRIVGRAWSGGGRRIRRVDFAAGDDWQQATLHGRAGDYAWTGWSVDWQASPGDHVLRCRATDADGNVQPPKAPWNLSGFAINSCHEVAVTVSDSFPALPD